MHARTHTTWIAQTGRLDLSEAESIPSVAKMLKEDSAVAYRNAVITIKEAARHLD
jgi:hypothetical protein